MPPRKRSRQSQENEDRQVYEAQRANPEVWDALPQRTRERKMARFEPAQAMGQQSPVEANADVNLTLPRLPSLDSEGNPFDPKPTQIKKERGSVARPSGARITFAPTNPDPKGKGNAGAAATEKKRRMEEEYKRWKIDQYEQAMQTGANGANYFRYIKEMTFPSTSARRGGRDKLTPLQKVWRDMFDELNPAVPQCCSREGRA